jgi:hypothetical protein
MQPRGIGEPLLRGFSFRQSVQKFGSRGASAVFPDNLAEEDDTITIDQEGRRIGCLVRRVPSEAIQFSKLIRRIKHGRHLVAAVSRPPAAAEAQTLPAGADPELKQRILDTTLKTRPPDATHWSVRTVARHLGVTRTLVHGIWRRFDVQPHRVERFKLSNDPKFEEKVRDVVGLYVDPPDRALVLCVHEKVVKSKRWTEPLPFCRYG